MTKESEDIEVKEFTDRDCDVWPGAKGSTNSKPLIGNAPIKKWPTKIEDDEVASIIVDVHSVQVIVGDGFYFKDLSFEMGKRFVGFIKSPIDYEQLEALGMESVNMP